MIKNIRALYEHYGQPELTNFRLDDEQLVIPSGAGVFALVTQGERIVMVRRRPRPDRPDWERFWWLPGGGHEPGEGLDETAIRELREETGFEIAVSKVILAGIRHNSRSWCYFVLRGHVIGGEASHHDDPDQTTAEVRCFLPSEIPVQDLWSDLDKIALVQEGLLELPLESPLQRTMLLT